MKPYSPAAGPYYTSAPITFDSNGLAVPEIPSAYSTQHFSYDYGVPPAPVTYSSEAPPPSAWSYPSDSLQYSKMSHNLVHDSAPMPPASNGPNVADYHQIYQPTSVYSPVSGYGGENGELKL